jgi:hypothetical protein
MKWLRAIAAFVAALVAGFLWFVAHDGGAFVGDDSPSISTRPIEPCR